MSFLLLDCASWFVPTHDDGFFRETRECQGQAFSRSNRTSTVGQTISPGLARTSQPGDDKARQGRKDTWDRPQRVSAYLWLRVKCLTAAGHPLERSRGGRSSILCSCLILRRERS